MKKPKDKYCKRPECVAGNGRHLARDCFRDAENRARRTDQRASAADRTGSKRSSRVVDLTGYERCSHCEGVARVTAIGLERHRRPSSTEWCRGGVAPEAKGKGKSKASVRTVRGGLPTLGKR